ADQWERITAGVEQRARALELFLRDGYGPGEIVRAGVVPQEALDRAPGYRRYGRAVPDGALHAPVSGADLVSTGPGEWLVLEDNLRMPGGLAMAVTVRDRIREGYPGFDARGEVHDPGAGLGALRDTLRAAAPDGVGDPSIAVVAGEDELSAHDLRHAAEAVDAPLITPARLRADEGGVWRIDGDERLPVVVLYVRMDEESLLSSAAADGTPLRAGLPAAMAARTGAGGNAPGHRGADDMVVKPIDGYGGSGITVGPECSPRELDERRGELRRHGERFVAQEVQSLSTLPTFDGDELSRRHVDLRAFIMLRNGPTGEVEASAPPVAVTRVAPAGTMLVNASSGGGGKDTWIRRACTRGSHRHRAHRRRADRSRRDDRDRGDGGVRIEGAGRPAGRRGRRRRRAAAHLVAVPVAGRLRPRARAHRPDRPPACCPAAARPGRGRGRWAGAGRDPAGRGPGPPGGLLPGRPVARLRGGPGRRRARTDLAGQQRPGRPQRAPTARRGRRHRAHRGLGRR